MSGSTPATFIDRARADYTACNRIVNSAFIVRKSRQAMVNLLEQAIVKAVRENDDRFLHVTYTDIDAMMQGWWKEDELKNRIAATLRALNLGQLQRQLPPAPTAPISASVMPPLSELGKAYLAVKKSEKLVIKCNKALDTANERLQKALDVTEAKLATAEAALATAESEVQRLTDENTDLKKRLEVYEKPDAPAFSLPSDSPIQRQRTKPRPPNEPLPDGWTEQRTKEGEAYYWHEATETSVWERHEIPRISPSPALRS